MGGAMAHLCEQVLVRVQILFCVQVLFRVQVLFCGQVVCLPVSSFCIAGGPFGPLADVCALCCGCKFCSRKFGPIADVQPKVAGNLLHAGNGRALLLLISGW